MENMLIKVANLKKESKSIDDELNTLPLGYLIKKREFHYQVINGKQMGITNNIMLIRQLCRKKYLISRKKQLTKHISKLTHFIEKFDIKTPKETIGSFSSAYQGLPKDYFFHPTMKTWLADSQSQNPYLQANAIYTSKNGIKLRSKSEVFIANVLEEHDIPYRYEDVRSLGKKKIYPDFTIKNPFNGKTILWEHFGALNQEGYEKNMNDKMDLYLKHGYIPFENLIYTFEFDIRDSNRLKSLVETIILTNE